MSTHLEKYLEGVVGVCEANSFERSALWANKLAGETWLQRGGGPLETIGHIDGRPICIALLADTIGGATILFWYATSQLVDYKMIDQWLIDNVPRSAFHKVNGEWVVNKSDANNFGNMLRQAKLNNSLL